MMKVLKGCWCLIVVTVVSSVVFAPTLVWVIFGVDAWKMLALQVIWWVAMTAARAAYEQESE